MITREGDRAVFNDLELGKANELSVGALMSMVFIWQELGQGGIGTERDDDGGEHHQ